MFSSISHANKQVLTTVLLFCLLIGGGHLPRLVDSAIFYLTIFGVAMLTYSRSRLLNITLGCSTLFFVLAWLRAFHDAHFNLLFCISGLLCLAYGIAAIIKTMIKAKSVSVSEVLGLINCYLIVGYAWALLYTLVEGYQPGSFVINVRADRLMDNFVYFSFATMTTVGYGDMLPHSILAQRLSVAQAVFGQFYFALVVAYLLNKLFMNRDDAGDKPPAQG